MPSKALRPKIIANFAITLDGKISTRNRTPSTFSSKQDKRRLTEIRAIGDAIIAGAGTVRADSMSMGISDPKLREERVHRGQSAYPVRVIVSNSGRLPPDLKLFAKRFSPIVIFASDRMPKRSREALASLASICLHPRRVDLPLALSTLRKSYGVKSAVCEGGGGLMRALLEIDAVDELYLTWCPIVFGGRKAPTLTGLPGACLPSAMRWKLLEMRPSLDTGECFLHYRRLRSRHRAE